MKQIIIILWALLLVSGNSATAAPALLDSTGCIEIVRTDYILGYQKVEYTINGVYGWHIEKTGL